MRPIIVTIIAVLYMLMGVLALISAICGLVGVNINLGFSGEYTGIIGIVVAVITLIVGYGLFVGWSWMWYIGLIVAAIYVIFGIYSIIKGNWAPLVNTVISVIVVWYLTRKNVKKFFLDS